MGGDYLATYLRDHLAGAGAGLELVDHIARLHAGDPIERFAADLRAEIAADRAELEELMGRLGVDRSRTKEAGAWISAQLSELKVHLEDLRDGTFRRFELWEARSIGIEGKRLLWRTLSSALGGRPEIAGIDLAELERRAEEQRRDVEARRLEAAKAAFGLSTRRCDGPR